MLSLRAVRGCRYFGLEFAKRHDIGAALFATDYGFAELQGRLARKFHPAPAAFSALKRNFVPHVRPLVSRKT
jgi:hypothetical protein